MHGIDAIAAFRSKQTSTYLLHNRPSLYRTGVLEACFSLSRLHEFRPGQLQHLLVIHKTNHYQERAMSDPSDETLQKLTIILVKMSEFC
jgi:hypothetical protein